MKFKSILFTLLFLLFTSPLFATQVTLSWNPNSESDLAGYKVYWGTATRTYTSNADAGNVLTYTVTGLTEGETYYFAATAYDFSGNESGYSNEVSYEVPIPEPVPDTTPPDEPEGIGVTGINIITWNENSESDLKGYIVYRDDRQFAATTEARITLKGRDKHKDWKDYYVKAYDTSGNLSGPSDTIRVKFRRNRIVRV